MLPTQVKSSCLKVSISADKAGEKMLTAENSLPIPAAQGEVAKQKTMTDTNQ